MQEEENFFDTIPVDEPVQNTPTEAVQPEAADPTAPPKTNFFDSPQAASTAPTAQNLIKDEDFRKEFGTRIEAYRKQRQEALAAGLEPPSPAPLMQFAKEAGYASETPNDQLMAYFNAEPDAPSRVDVDRREDMGTGFNMQGLGAFVRGGNMGAYNFADEIIAGVSAIPALLDDNKSYADEYRKNHLYLNSIEELDEVNNPDARLAGQFAGAATQATVPLGMVAKTASVVPLALRSAAVGGVQGAAAGAGRGTDTETRVNNAMEDSAIGTTLGGTIPVAGKVAATVAAPIISRGAELAAKIAPNIIDPAVVTARQVARSLGLDVDQLKTEVARQRELGGDPTVFGALEEGAQDVVGSAGRQRPENRAAFQAAADESRKTLPTRVAGQAERLAPDKTAPAEEPLYWGGGEFDLTKSNRGPVFATPDREVAERYAADYEARTGQPGKVTELVSTDKEAGGIVIDEPQLRQALSKLGYTDNEIPDDPKALMDMLNPEISGDDASDLVDRLTSRPLNIKGVRFDTGDGETFAQLKTYNLDVREAAPARVTERTPTPNQEVAALSSQRGDFMDEDMAAIRETPYTGITKPEVYGILSSSEGLTAVKAAQGLETDLARRRQYDSLLDAIKQLGDIDPRLPLSTQQSIASQLLRDARVDIGMIDKISRELNGAGEAARVAGRNDRAAKFFDFGKQLREDASAEIPAYGAANKSFSRSKNVENAVNRGQEFLDEGDTEKFLDDVAEARAGQAAPAPGQPRPQRGQLLQVSDFLNDTEDAFRTRTPQSYIRRMRPLVGKNDTKSLERYAELERELRTNFTVTLPDLDKALRGELNLNDVVEGVNRGQPRAPRVEPATAPEAGPAPKKERGEFSEVDPNESNEDFAGRLRRFRMEATEEGSQPLPARSTPEPEPEPVIEPTSISDEIDDVFSEEAEIREQLSSLATSARILREAPDLTQPQRTSYMNDIDLIIGALRDDYDIPESLLRRIADGDGPNIGTVARDYANPRPVAPANNADSVRTSSSTEPLPAEYEASRIGIEDTIGDIYRLRNSLSTENLNGPQRQAVASAIDDLTRSLREEFNLPAGVVHNIRHGDPIDTTSISRSYATSDMTGRPYNPSARIDTDPVANPDLISPELRMGVEGARDISAEDLIEEMENYLNEVLTVRGENGLNAPEVQELSDTYRAILLDRGYTTEQIDEIRRYALEAGPDAIRLGNMRRYTRGPRNPSGLLLRGEIGMDGRMVQPNRASGEPRPLRRQPPPVAGTSRAGPSANRTMPYDQLDSLMEGARGTRSSEDWQRSIRDLTDDQFDQLHTYIDLNGTQEQRNTMMLASRMREGQSLQQARRAVSREGGLQENILAATPEEAQANFNKQVAERGTFSGYMSYRLNNGRRVAASIYWSPRMFEGRPYENYAEITVYGMQNHSNRANTIGEDVMRAIAEEITRRYPQIKGVTGVRATGASVGKASSGGGKRQSVSGELKRTSGRTPIEGMRIGARGAAQEKARVSPARANRVAESLSGEGTNQRARTEALIGADEAQKLADAMAMESKTTKDLVLRAPRSNSRTDINTALDSDVTAGAANVLYNPTSPIAWLREGIRYIHTLGVSKQNAKWMMDNLLDAKKTDEIIEKLEKAVGPDRAQQVFELLRGGATLMQGRDQKNVTAE